MGTSYHVFGERFRCLAFVMIIITVESTLYVSGRNADGNNQLSMISGCVCSGYNVTFTCTIIGGGNTIWNGNAFNCPTNSDSNNNQILLRHSGFGYSSMGTCNGGNITGKGVSSENGCFVSELNVTVSSSVINRQVSCFYENGSAEILVGTVTIELTSGDELSSPSKVSLIEASPHHLNFTWMPVTHSCSALSYNIYSTNCGECPTITNTSSTICSLPQLQPNDILICNIRVQAVICDGIEGQSSNISTYILKVPDTPLGVVAVPTYSQENKTLLLITISFPEMQSPPISDQISSSPIAYNFFFYNTSSDDMPCYSSTILPASFCKDELCSKEFNITSTSCSNSSQIVYTVLATNIFGDGMMTMTRVIETSNSFVHIEFDEVTRTILCVFSNQEDTSEKQCSIEYFQCQRQLLSTRHLNVTNITNPLQIPLTLMSDTSNRATYCYVVTASNTTYMVHVQGTLEYGQSSSDSSTAVIAGVVTGVLFIAVVVIILIVIVFVLYCFLSRKKRPSNDEKEFEVSEIRKESENLQHIEEGRFTIYAVDKNCELSSLIVKHNLTYRIGGVYYEFARNEEDVTEDKGVILMDKLSKTLFTGENAKQMIGLPAEGTLRKPNLKDYRVFIQSKGIGRRPLIKGTCILYEANPLYDGVGNDQDLIPVNSKRFKKLQVKKVCQLQKFVEDDCGLTYVRGCAFYEFSHKTEDIDKDKEVILMSKATGDMFTGPGAMGMIPGAPGIKVTRPELPEWRVFVQSKYLGARHLDAGTLVLYEEPKASEDGFTPDNNYRVLEVSSDCLMEEFVVNEIGKYELSRVLFEFTNKAEEITEDKKVVIMNKKTKEIVSGPKVLEMVGAPCAPGKQVNNPQLKEYRVFVQSAGGGTRFLEAGTCLLYENK